MRMRELAKIIIIKKTYKIQVMEPNGKGPHGIPRHAKREEY
jgi:hypothetical protein